MPARVKLGVWETGNKKGQYFKTKMCIDFYIHFGHKNVYLKVFLKKNKNSAAYGGLKPLNSPLSAHLSDIYKGY